MNQEGKTFEELGRGYQEKVVQALFEDAPYADMMMDVFDPEYFTYTHLKAITRVFFDYKTRYREFPSVELAMLQLQRDEGQRDPAMMVMAVEFAKRVVQQPLNGDRAWIQESSLEFCRRQKIIAALGKCLQQVENQSYDKIAATMRDALDKGQPRDHGHDYVEESDVRAQKSVRDPIPTGWSALDSRLGGGWERKTITTFIAPTGAGKSMFLVNCAAALVAQGLNVLYVTLEMADYKIGLRTDSWFSGLSIDDSAKTSNKETIKSAIKERVKGRLIIKEWPTKRATVETIRSHIQYLKNTKNFRTDVLIVDYPDLLKCTRTYGEKRHELEGNYEELRGLGQEENAVVIVADQTNRGGLDMELVGISAIAEAYAKATVCDLIITISRTAEDKMHNTGRLFIAKSRLGQDGVVLPFILNTGKNVRVDVMEPDEDPISMMVKAAGEEGMRKHLEDRLKEFGKKPVQKLSEVPLE